MHVENRTEAPDCSATVHVSRACRCRAIIAKGIGSSAAPLMHLTASCLSSVASANILTACGRMLPMSFETTDERQGGDSSALEINYY